jgi:hypothetical protein
MTTAISPQPARELAGDGLPALLPELPDLLEPTAPYVRPILEIHRGPDGYVTFHRKRGEQLENLGSVCVAELQAMFPEFAAELERDSYFSINSFYRPGWFGNCLPGLKPAYRKAEGARYLNACFVDIDFHDQAGPFDFGYRFGQLITLQEQKIIPPASLVMRSGRGIWLFWLLCNTRNELIPPRAWPEQVLAFVAVQRELVSRTGADCAATDVARITRVPGSVNTKTFPGDPDRVMYWRQFRVDGRGYTYTLEALSEFLGLQWPEIRPAHRDRTRAQESERGLRGWNALWQQRFHDFESLRNMRGGFHDGCRNHAAYAYAVILRKCGFDDAAISCAVKALGEECSPPLNQERINWAIDQSKASRGQIRDSKIAGWLNITPKEAQLIPRWSTQRSALPEVSDTMRNLNRMELKQLRRDTMGQIVHSLGGRLPSARKMAELLAQRGFSVSHVQVAHDYRLMQLISGEDRCPLLLLNLNASREREKGKTA